MDRTAVGVHLSGSSYRKLSVTGRQYGPGLEFRAVWTLALGCGKKIMEAKAGLDFMYHKLVIQEQLSVNGK